MSKLKWLFSAAKCGIYYAEIITRTGRDEMGTAGELQRWNGNCKRETGRYSRSEKHNMKQTNIYLMGLVTEHEKWEDQLNQKMSKQNLF